MCVEGTISIEILRQKHAVKMSPSKSTKPSVVVPAKVAKLEELILFNSKLRFCPEQLQNLNYLFHKKLEKKTEPPDNG